MVRSIVFGAVAVTICAGLSFGQETVAKPPAEGASPAAETKWAPAVKPKPLSENVKRGLEWLVKHQHENGGWAQGEESANMGRGMDPIKDKPSVGDTCAAVLALMRSGSTPKNGPYAENIRKGLDFICAEVGKADEKTLYVTSVRNTRLQMKLGTYIDTFLSAALLAEAKDAMADAKSRKKIIEALDTVMDKIETNQRPDGTWANEGWATDLAQNMATKAVNVAGARGVTVKEETRARAQVFAAKQFEAKQGTFGVGGSGSAGVELYAGSASVNSLQQTANTDRAIKAEVQKKVADALSPGEKAEAEATLARIDKNEKDLKAAKEAIVKKIEDKRFIAGFGSNGGEEFLSYMNIGESLVVDGGKEWEKWDKSITANLNNIQNKDGSWTGHHCITGRTFCTSAALLVLMTDRAPVPVAAKMKRR